MSEGASRGARRRFLDTGFVFGSRIASMALFFAAGVATARVFEAELRGEYGMLTTVAGFGTAFANVGVPQAIVYFYNRGEAGVSRSVTAALLGFGLSLALLALAGVFLLGWLQSSYFPRGGVRVAAVALTASAGLVLAQNLSALLQAQGRFLRGSAILLVAPTIFAGGLVPLLLLGRGLTETALLYAAAQWAGALAFLTPYAGSVAPRSLDTHFVGQVFGFGLKSYSNTIVTVLNYRVDMFIVAYLIQDLAAVAYYHIAASVAGLMWLVPDSYGTVIYPRLSRHASERERTREAIQGMRLVLVPVVAGAVALGLAASWLVPLVFGERYAAASPLLMLLLPGVVAMSLSKILTRYLLSRNRHELNTVCIGIGVAVNVAANLILIPRIGILGGAISSTLGSLATTGGLALAFARMAELQASDLREFPGRELRVYAGLAGDLLSQARR